MKQLKLIDKHDRSKLCEGRSCGFGGGFAVVNTDKSEVEMKMPATACGDFLAEVVHSEKTGKSWSIYGFQTKKENIYDLKNGVTHIVNSILPLNNAGKHAEYDKEFAALEKNWKNIEKFLNWFENKFDIKIKTKISRIEENKYLFTFSLWWTNGTYKISLYKFLSRAAIYYDGKQDPVEYLDKLTSNDRYHWNAMRTKVLDMLGGFIPEQVMTINDSCPHNLGIITFHWPRELNKVK